MTPDIEQIRARLEALKTGWTSIAQWQQMALDFRRHIIEDESALLAAIDELTAQLRALQSWAEGVRTDLAELTVQRDAVLALVNSQAEDEGLWFIAATAPEAYLQQELRKLHAVIEGALGVEQ